MTTKEIKLLVQASYAKDKLDEKKVERITKLLSKKDLKAYVRGLTLEEKKHKVYIALPTKAIYNRKRKDLETLFTGKEIIFNEDPSLLLGIRILDNDMLYELSLSDRLNRLTQEVGENY
jgi:F0F1-type ATP synthase delta subunit